MALLSGSVVDWGALGKILAVSVIAGAGVVGAFGYVLLGVSRYQRVRTGSARTGYILLVVLGGGVCLAAVVLGLFGLAHK